MAKAIGNPGIRDARVDAYIAKARPFAQPILEHLRELMHTACPEVEETIKWSMPSFVLHGVILGNIAAFKEHCSIGLWGPEMAAVLAGDGATQSTGMGKFGKLQSLKDLPSDKALLGYFRQAATLIASGERTKSFSRPAKKAAKAAPEIPAELIAALKKNKVAHAAFATFSPSGQREYAEWISEAKRPETKEKRVVQAVEWIAEGKPRHWKYQNC